MVAQVKGTTDIEECKKRDMYVYAAVSVHMHTLYMRIMYACEHLLQRLLGTSQKRWLANLADVKVTMKISYSTWE